MDFSHDQSSLPAARNASQLIFDFLLRLLFKGSFGMMLDFPHRAGVTSGAMRPPESSLGRAARTLVN
jgi:hypothetical protein